MILDIGCGKAKREGIIGVDFVEMPEVNIVCDLNRDLPFPDNSVDGIYASHILEHLDNFLFTMNEIWRVCRPNAWIKIWVPHFSSGTTTWGDPTYKRPFTISTFEYFKPSSNVHYIKARFKVEDIKLNFNLGGKHSKGTKLKHLVYFYLGKMIEKFVKRNYFAQKRFESRWCQLFPFSELYIQL
ncbi:hypothetical protein ES703_119599 [subsurface metagenome]